MFFLRPRNVQCPHCRHRFFTDFRGSKENQQALKSGQPLVCPECKNTSNYPRSADWIFGTGLLFAILVLPIEHNTAFFGVGVPPLAVFSTVLVIFGAYLRRLKKT